MRARIIPTIAMAGLILIGCFVMPAGAGATKETRVKAACLYHIIRSTRWMSRATGDLPIMVGFMGEDINGMATVFAEELRALPDEGAPIDIHRIPAGDSVGGGMGGDIFQAIEGCRVLFLFATGLDQMESLVRAATAAGVLTVGETESMISYGGCVSLLLRSARIQIHVNPLALEAAGLQLGAQVMQHAILHH